MTFGWERVTVDVCSAAVCLLSKKTITKSHESYEGSSVLVPDGTEDTYGKNQEYLRVQASTFFGGNFQSNFGSVYVSALPKADLTYPEVMAADFISGYVRERVEQGRIDQITELDGCVGWIDENWREPDTDPASFYAMGSLTADYGNVEKTRIVSWIRGKCPESPDYDGSNQYPGILDQLERESLKEYLGAFEY